jgi:hypothetical protein
LPSQPQFARARRAASYLLNLRVVLLFVLPLLVMWFAWPPLQLGGGPGLDPSWQAALEVATHSHLAYGTQVLWTYGPLGFLYVAASGGFFTWFSGLATLGFVYTLLSRFALAWFVFHGARRSFGTIFGFILATAVLRVWQTPDVPVFLIALVWVLDTQLSDRKRELVCLLGGSAAGIELLEKVSIGFTAALLVAIAVVCLPRQRVRVGIETIAALLFTLIVAWLVAGQPLSALTDYLHSAERMSAGYSNAMQASAVGWQTAAAAFAAGLGFWMAWRDTGEISLRQRIGVLLLWAVFSLSMYKEGYTRADGSHTPLYLGALLSGLFAFRIRAPDRAASVIGVSALAFLCLAVTGGEPSTLWRVDLGVSSAVHDARNLLTPSQLRLDADSSRVNIKMADAVPQKVLGLLRGHSVDVVPSELAIIYGYRLDWRPEPVLQGYAAYTPWLDSYDAAFLRSRAAPSRLLLQAGYGSIDNRLLSYDQPEATVAMLCDYRPILTSPYYAVLARTNFRCGPEHLIKTLKAGWGQTVSVPKPGRGQLVLLRLTGVTSGIFESANDLLAQAPIRTITLNGSPTAYRLIPAVAADGLPLATAAALDYPVPFNTALAVTKLAVGNASVTPTAGEAHSLTYSFYTMTIKPWRSVRR